MIKINSVDFSYGKQFEPALRDINATIDPGMHLLLGENGAGKTTLLKIIAGLLFPTSGECMVDGVSTRHRLPSEMMRTIYLGSDTTAPMRDIATMASHHACFYPDFDINLLNRYLDKFGISPDQRLSDMSLGTCHKAMLAYVISLNTEVLLLDEPANGLDIESKQVLQKMLIESATDERIIIVSTHNIADMQNLYDGLLVMEGSRMLLQTDTERIDSRLAFVQGFSEIPGSLFSEWTGGALRSILPAHVAEEMGISGGPIDFQLLYSALHSPRCKATLDIIHDAIPFENYDNKH